MPIYMDFHDLPEVSIEESRKAHLKDISIQEKYKVKYLQYWINEQEGKAYCLIEGPNKEACEATHREANGITACNLVEVSGGMYDLFLGDNQKIDHGLVRHLNGQVDNGYRYILSLDFITPLHPIYNPDKAKLSFDQLKLECIALVEKYQGRDINQPEETIILGVFWTPEAAMKCSLDLRNHLLKRTSTSPFKLVKFKMALCVGQPVTSELGFFEEALNSAVTLSNISKHTEIICSKFFSRLSNLQEPFSANKGFRIIAPNDEKFLNSLQSVIDKNLGEEALNVSFLSSELGVSRPQLYRKIKALSGDSPNHFIRNQRLKQALQFIKEKRLNISEIAAEVGFNNPSYFSKCFHNKFGISPSKLN